MSDALQPVRWLYDQALMGHTVSGQGFTNVRWASPMRALLIPPWHLGEPGSSIKRRHPSVQRGTRRKGFWVRVSRMSPGSHVMPFERQQGKD